jgi:RimJ/RimL family protein N-acetyltransferase
MLITQRLQLVPATVTLIDAELAGPQSLEAQLHASVPSDWPPEHHEPSVLEFWRGRLKDPASAGWWMHYVLLLESERPTVVASVGYKGPPSDGVVEIGYSVVPSRQRRGLATEACRALIEAAWERGATSVLAHTFEELVPSIGVLRKLGFKRVGLTDDGELEFRLDRAH